MYSIQLYLIKVCQWLATDSLVLGLSWPWSYGSWIYNYLCNQCLSPLKLCVRNTFMARCTWFSPVSSTNKTGHYDITEILLKVALNTINHNPTCNRSNIFFYDTLFSGPWSYGSWIYNLLPVQSVPITSKSCEFEPRSWWGVLDTTLCDKVCQWLATGRWFSPGTPPIKLAAMI